MKMTERSCCTPTEKRGTSMEDGSRVYKRDCGNRGPAGGRLVTAMWSKVTSTILKY